MDELQKLRRELIVFLGGPLPDPVPLAMRVLSKRKFLEHEEWKIEYDVETAETIFNAIALGLFKGRSRWPSRSNWSRG